MYARYRTLKMVDVLGGVGRNRMDSDSFGNPPSRLSAEIVESQVRQTNIPTNGQTGGQAGRLEGEWTGGQATGQAGRQNV